MRRVVKRHSCTDRVDRVRASEHGAESKSATRPDGVIFGANRKRTDLPCIAFDNGDSASRYDNARRGFTYRKIGKGLIRLTKPLKKRRHPPGSAAGSRNTTVGAFDYLVRKAVPQAVSNKSGIRGDYTVSICNGGHAQSLSALICPTTTAVRRSAWSRRSASAASRAQMCVV